MSEVLNQALATKRLHLELSPHNASMFESLMRDLGFSKNVELVNFALTLASWCVNERKGGKKIVSMTRAGGDVTELFFPMMAAALAATAATNANAGNGNGAIATRANPADQSPPTQLAA